MMRFLSDIGKYQKYSDKLEKKKVVGDHYKKEKRQEEAETGRE